LGHDDERCDAGNQVEGDDEDVEDEQRPDEVQIGSA
jgi:hypothetical protein